GLVRGGLPTPGDVDELHALLDGVEDRGDGVGVVTDPALTVLHAEELERKDLHVPIDSGDPLAVVPDRAEDARDVGAVVVVGGTTAGVRGVVDDVGVVKEVVGVRRVDVAGQIGVPGVDAGVDDRHRGLGGPGLDTPSLRAPDVVARGAVDAQDPLARVQLTPLLAGVGVIGAHRRGADHVVGL